MAYSPASAKARPPAIGVPPAEASRVGAVAAAAIEAVKNQGKK